MSERLHSISYTLSPIDLRTRSTPVKTIKKYYSCFTESLCFQFTIIVVIVGFILNVIGWALMLILFMAGAADRTIPDEDTRKIWIEIDSQVLNGMFFVPIVSFLPWRLRNLYQLHSKRYRPRLLKRYSYSASIIWIGIFTWAHVINAVFVIAIAVCLWSINRHDRPTWVMGILVGFAIFTGVTGGVIEFIIEQRAKKKVKHNRIQSYS
ncbi:hypothetical protein I4U23_022442 [Adineta vaga]|nr:hypothetical protein I4U23_022442 [Adineta vaga]